MREWVRKRDDQSAFRPLRPPSLRQGNLRRRVMLDQTYRLSKAHDLAPVHVLLQTERRPQGMGSRGPTPILHTSLRVSNNRPLQ